MFLLFFPVDQVSQTPFGDFRANRAGHWRSHGAHRRETHAVGTSRVGLSNAPGASVLPCVWTAPGALAAVKSIDRLQFQLGRGRWQRVKFLVPIA